MKAGRFFRELKRRKVYRVAAAYCVVAWLIIQVTTQTFPFLEIPEWVTRLVIVLVILGFPLAMVLSWLFDLTPEGVKRTEDEEAPGTAGNGTTAPAQIPVKSVAVLPFDNLSDDPHNAFFAEGIHDDIITNLAKIADLKVISRISVQQFRGGGHNLREISAALGVAHVLQGSIRRDGRRIRVNAQLLNALSDAHVWGERFDREINDIFELQSELAERITLALRANISPRERASLQVRPTKDLGAYELYLRARDLFHWSGIGDAQENDERALPLLEEAVERDPGFALAYALISRIHAEIYWFGCDKRPERLEQCRAAAERALAVQPGLGESHLALGFYHYYKDRNYAEARRQFEAALRAAPNDADMVGASGILDRREGRWDAAIPCLERAYELDPRNTAVLWNLLETCTFLGRYERARAVIDDALAVWPGAHLFRLARAGLVLRDRGDTSEFKEALRNIPADFDPGALVTTSAIRVALMDRDYAEAERRLARTDQRWFNDNGVAGMAAALDGYTVPRSWYEGLIARGRGEPTKAREAFLAARAAIEKDFQSWAEDEKTIVMLGLAHAALGERERALELGRRATGLLPMSIDAIDGPLIATNLAVIYAETGAHEEALALLKQLNNLPAGVTPGLLRAEPQWDPLREYPEFKQLAAG